MCHQIFWPYALCGHILPNEAWLLKCRTAIRTGSECELIETIQVPVYGQCDWCLYHVVHGLAEEETHQANEEVANADADAAAEGDVSEVAAEGSSAG
jgi:hypothetical protein